MVNYGGSIWLPAPRVVDRSLTTLYLLIKCISDICACAEMHLGITGHSKFTPSTVACLNKFVKTVNTTEEWSVYPKR